MLLAAFFPLNYKNRRRDMFRQKLRRHVKTGNHPSETEFSGGSVMLRDRFLVQG